MSAPTASLVQQLRAVVHEQSDSGQRDLADLVRIASVSAPAFDQREVARSAEAVAELLRGAGLPEVEVLAVPGGRPAVLGHLPADSGAPRVLLYAHHDVQPPGPAEAWHSEPFEPVRRGSRLYGRGAADDKAGIMVHIGAIRALQAAAIDAGVGVSVLVEGEEEIGSPTLAQLLTTRPDLASCDVVVVADSTNWQIGKPALTTSLRGLVDLVVEVEVFPHALHSGIFGGAVLDAHLILARLLATLHDDAGDVAVAGLLRAPDPSVDYDEDIFRTDAGLPASTELVGTGPLSARLWTRAAISVIGMDTVSIAESSNTLQPRASAKVSVRLAPGQEPRDALESVRAHLVSRAPFGARVRVVPGEQGSPFAAASESPAMVDARWSFAEAWGTPPVDIGIGGSIPFVAALLERAPDVQVLITGVEDPDSRAHGADESVHLGELEKAVLAEALLLVRLGARADW